MGDEAERMKTVNTIAKYLFCVLWYYKNILYSHCVNERVIYLYQNS